MLTSKIINQWARPIFNLATDYKSLSKEEIQERDKGVLKGRKRQETNNDPEEGLRPGDPGWCYRARVPQSQRSEYVNRPKWENDVDMSRGKKQRSTTKLDKFIKVAVEQKRNGKKTKRAVDISIEGRKMAL